MSPGQKTVLLFFLIAGITFLSQAGVFADFLQPVSGQASGDYGYYQVGSSPSGADVVFDGKFVGETPVTVPVFSSSTPGHTLSVSKMGYVTWTQSFSQNPVAGQAIPVFAPLQPTEATGSIKVMTSPTGALVNVDGVLGQTSPWIYTGVPVGGHVVQAFLSGFSPYSGPVEVTAGQTAEVFIMLYPLTSTGALQVVTSPGGADLYVDGIYKGKTSTAIGSIATGTHVVALKHYGYQDLTGEVFIEEGKTTYLSFTLIPFTDPSTGNLRISSDPAGAGIYIDGTYQGVTHAGGPTVFTGIDPGSYSVELKMSNYQGYSETVEIGAGATSTVSANLAQSPNPGPYASVEISSVPSGASVFLDDTVQGITPVTLSSVPAGRHGISIRMTGYSDYSTIVQLSPGQSVLISSALAPVPTTVPTTKASSGLLPLMVAPIVAAAIIKRYRASGKQ
ncbi:MAG: PEGA domain-containing protein [Methanomicrobiales archaeon]